VRRLRSVRVSPKVIQDHLNGSDSSMKGATSVALKAA
jgi:hypothetical protein